MVIPLLYFCMRCKSPWFPKCSLAICDLFKATVNYPAEDPSIGGFKLLDLFKATSGVILLLCIWCDTEEPFLCVTQHCSDTDTMLRWH